MKTSNDGAPERRARFTFPQPLLRIIVAAAATTAITWLNGMLFGPVSDTRARVLAQRLAAPIAPRDAALAVVVGREALLRAQRMSPY